MDIGVFKESNYPLVTGLFKNLGVAWVCLLTTLSSGLHAEPSFPTKLETSQSKRLISAGGSITEILHHLGMAEQLIAIDTSSLYPAEIQSLPKVGYFRALSAEGVLSLQPNLLVAAKGAGPKAVLEQIENVGVRVKLFDQLDYDLASWKSLVTEMGEYFGAIEQSAGLIESAIAQFEQLKAKRNYPLNQINAVSLLSIGQRGPMVAGENTMPDFLFNHSGLRNLGAAVDGYKPINNEVLITQKIDLILIPSHMEKALGGKAAICNSPVIKLALRKDCNIVVMDGLLLMEMGARISLALEKVIHSANRLTLTVQ